MIKRNKPQIAIFVKLWIQNSKLKPQEKELIVISDNAKLHYVISLSITYIVCLKIEKCNQFVPPLLFQPCCRKDNGHPITTKHSKAFSWSGNSKKKKKTLIYKT